MKKWFRKLRTQPKIQNRILLVLFVMLFILPEQYIYTDIAYVVILFFISYISTYTNTEPIWKGLLYSFCVTAIVIAVFLTTLSLFPHIPYILLLIIVAVTGILSTYWIGSNSTADDNRVKK
jgi:hypothetical protein